MTRPSIALAAACLACPSVACAAGSPDAVAIPWGEWLSTALSTAASALVPVRWVQAGFEAQARAMRDHLSPT